MPSSPRALAGLKLLLVEDNFLVAEQVRDILSRHGCDVVGPAPRLAKALELASTSAALHGAVLDVNLDGELCFPIARALAARRVPFLFLTGYDTKSIVPPDFRATIVLSKPVEESKLVATAVKMFTPSERPP